MTPMRATAARVTRARLTPARRRAILHGLVIAGLLLDAVVLATGFGSRHTVGADAFAYWSLDIARSSTRR